MSLVLRELGPDDEASFLTAYQAFQDPHFFFALAYEAEKPFADYLQKLDWIKRGTNLPQGYVPGIMLFGFLGDTIIGRVSFRHTLNEFLSRFGGHLGYGVVPGHRNKGYATLMLRQALDLARAQGLTKALLVCDADNASSRKVIEKCGGKFEGECLQEEPKKKLLRFWITLGEIGGPKSPPLFPA